MKYYEIELENETIKLRLTSSDCIEIEKKTGRIVFVEVKARKSINYGYGREAVDVHKLFKIRQTASLYLKTNKKLDQPIRIDVVEIMGNQISHLVAVQ